MEHEFRRTARGDMQDLKRTNRELQQQLNDLKESNRLLHVENQRLRQHLKGLEAALVGGVVPHVMGADGQSNSVDITLIAAAATPSWSGMASARASTAPGGSLRASLAGNNSVIRAFKKAAAEAKQQACRASGDLLSSQEQVHQLQQELQQLGVRHRQLSVAHSQLQSTHATLQERGAASIEAHKSRVKKLETDEAALQEQLQQLQQVVSSKQQRVLQQLERQLAQQQDLKAGYQQQLQALSAKHAEELQQQYRQLQQEHETAHVKAIQTESELTHIKAILTQMADADISGALPGWTRQGATLMPQLLCTTSNQEAVGVSTIVTAAEQQQQLECHMAKDAYSKSVQQQHLQMPASSNARVGKPVKLQLLLHSLGSQPGLIGVSRQQWWPIVLVHAVGAADKVVATNTGLSKQACVSTAQLLAAVAAKCPVGSHSSCNSSNSSNRNSNQQANGDSLHHQLQLQLPGPFNAASGTWLAHGQLSVGMINAHAAAVGVFQLPWASTAVSNSRVFCNSNCQALDSTEPAVQRDGLALAVLLAVSQSCWVVGVYQVAESGGPGAWLGFLGHAGDVECNWVNTDMPALQPGEFLVPVSGQHTPTGAAAGCNTDIYSAACRSRLFKKTGRHIVLSTEQPQDQAVKADGASSGGVVCEVWQLQPAAARAAASQACASKEMNAAKEPWRGALDVLATAMMPVSTASSEPSAEEAAAQRRARLLAPYSTAFAAHDVRYGVHMLPGSNTEAELGGSTVSLLHPKGKAVAQLQAVLRYVQKLQ